MKSKLSIISNGLWEADAGKEAHKIIKKKEARRQRRLGMCASRDVSYFLKRMLETGTLMLHCNLSPRLSALIADSNLNLGLFFLLILSINWNSPNFSFPRLLFFCLNLFRCSSFHFHRRLLLFFLRLFLDHVSSSSIAQINTSH